MWMQIIGGAIAGFVALVVTWLGHRYSKRFVLFQSRRAELEARLRIIQRALAVLMADGIRVGLNRKILDDPEAASLFNSRIMELESQLGMLFGSKQEFMAVHELIRLLQRLQDKSTGSVPDQQSTDLVELRAYVEEVRQLSSELQRLAGELTESATVLRKRLGLSDN